MRRNSEVSLTVLGLDIGGTRIKGAIVAEDGRILAARQIQTPASMEEFRAGLRSLVSELVIPPWTPGAVGVACKGIIDTASTRIIALPGTLSYLEGYLLSELLYPALPADCPVVADNDARVALIGECLWGAARDCHNACMLTLGTGIGGAILANGQILRGAGGIAGHLGHMTVDYQGGDCICGGRGCIETIFSARALESHAYALVHHGVATSLREIGPSSITCADIFRAARAGDAASMRMIDRATSALGAFIAGLIHLLDPELIILSGQIADSVDMLLENLQQEMQRRTQGLVRRTIPIVKSQLVEPSGVIGAAALARSALRS